MGQDDIVAVVQEKCVSADVEVQVVDKLAQMCGVVQHAVPFNGAVPVAGVEDDIGVVIQEEGVATHIYIACCDKIQVVDELAEIGGVMEHAVPFNGSYAGTSAVVGQDDVGVVVEEKGVAVQRKLQVVLGEEIQVVDKLAQACGSIAQTVVQETPFAEEGVAFVVDEVLAKAVGNGSVGGVMGIGHSQNLLCGGQGVIVTAVGVDFADNEVRPLSPVDVGELVGVFANHQCE